MPKKTTVDYKNYPELNHIRSHGKKYSFTKKLLIKCKNLE